MASVRTSLLVAAQSGDAADVAVTQGGLTRLRAHAAAIGQSAFAELSSRCLDEIERVATRGLTGGAHSPLDLVAQMEAELWAMPTPSDEFIFDVEGFVDASFDNLVAKPEAPISQNPVEGFEIDEETLEIFRAEADELLTNIDGGLRALALSPDDQTAIWDIRRNAHTFKGAAGIVGLRDACRIAHQMEDLLDRMVETRREAAPAVIQFLELSAGSLASIVAAPDSSDATTFDDDLYRKAMSSLSSGFAEKSDDEGNSANGRLESPPPAESACGSIRTAATPVVRVSLDRLDEIIRIAHSLSINRASLAARFADIPQETVCDAAILTEMASLFAAGRLMADDVMTKIRRIRMVKFGTLETRLSRAVNVTCGDENKKAVVEIENGDAEIDTQIIDALIEPLLHLLKNAVVHGIESPETRRLIGKPERGSIRIRLDGGEDLLMLSVSDDGGGISITKLKTEALALGLIDQERAASMADDEAAMLIFDRGLTTAEKLDLNAGRGVGMSIVKESVESRGGTILVETEPRKGTAFTIMLPLTTRQPLSKTAENADEREPAETLAPLVLIVDDSSSVRHQTAKLAEDEGFRVITAANGAEALELLLSGAWEPDLILSDIEMPQIDGWEFLEYLKTDDNLGHIPVVMVTSLDSEEHRQRALQLGAEEYLVKPFSAQFLARILEKFVNRLAVF